MTNKDFGITISLIENGEEIAQRSAESFEIAEQNLGSLERWQQEREFEAEQTGIVEEERSMEDAKDIEEEMDRDKEEKVED